MDPSSAELFLSFSFLSRPTLDVLSVSFVWNPHMILSVRVHETNFHYHLFMRRGNTRLVSFCDFYMLIHINVRRENVNHKWHYSGSIERTQNISVFSLHFLVLGGNQSKLLWRLKEEPLSQPIYSQKRFTVFCNYFTHPCQVFPHPKKHLSVLALADGLRFLLAPVLKGIVYAVEVVVARWMCSGRSANP